MVFHRIQWTGSSVQQGAGLGCSPESPRQGRRRPVLWGSWSWPIWDWAGGHYGNPQPIPPSEPSASHTLLGDPWEEKTKHHSFTAGLNNWSMQYFYKQNEKHTLFSTLLTSLANSLEQTSKWNIFPQFDTHAPRSYGGENTHLILDSSLMSSDVCTLEIEACFLLIQ